MSNITAKLELIRRINTLQTELFGIPVDAKMFDMLIEESEGGLSGIVLALLLMKMTRLRDTL
jgi:hypothetical protein